MDRAPLSLMTGAEQEAYCAWLKRFAGKRRGSIADYLRRAAKELSGNNYDR